MPIQLTILIIIVILNVFSYMLMGIDKSYAQQGHYRISEDMLVTMAVIGGSIGILTGMYQFRHKTKKPKFAYGIPLILLIQGVLFMMYGFPFLLK